MSEGALNSKNGLAAESSCRKKASERKMSSSVLERCCHVNMLAAEAASLMVIVGAWDFHGSASRCALTQFVTSDKMFRARSTVD